ncbi:HIT family protein [Cryptosporangium sp. NPDC051539]|uniref:HIT family protein n=1 Tax=Cryptosporangium sp. NPDC051539 TaxID=3363962 RepID=UPI0037BCE205
MSPDCIFCKRDDAELHRIVVENETCYARYDNFPASDGHVEVVPKRHVVSYFDLTERELVDAHRLVLAVRDVLATEFAPDGFTIGINEGRAAGRTIDHLHIHLIPRYLRDVADPRGGVRKVVPDRWNADDWASPAASTQVFAATAAGGERSSQR